jgi:hypothetical protein
MLAALAFCIKTRKRGLVEGSGPLALTAIVISLPMRVKVRDILPQRLSFLALRYSNALPIVVFI